MANLKTLKNGRVIIFEGLDGVGKSTQIELTSSLLTQQGWQVYVTRNLGGSPIGEALRAVYLSNLPRPAMTDLYVSAGIQEALIESIQAERSKGSIVLIDRGPLSLAVYQSFGSGLDKDLVWQFADRGMKQHHPELTIVYDLDVTTALNRARQHGSQDYFESKPKDYFDRVKAGFKEAAKRYDAKIISASQPIPAVHDQTMTLINQLIT